MMMKEKLMRTRRKFLQSAGLMLMACGLNAEHVIAESKHKTGFKGIHSTNDGKSK